MHMAKCSPAFRRIALAVALGAALPRAGWAQEAGEPPSRPVVQPLPPAQTAELTEALRRIAADSRDVEALLMAGRASLSLQDPDAAIGFFTRARDLPDGGAMAKAGIAASLVYKKMPFEALRLFAEADAEGASPAAFAADYGLALDLVGDNVQAQKYYHIALRDHEDPEVTRRLALSQAIGGDQAASEMTLLPLLQRQDLAAYRARAFALAVLGRTEEAVTIAEAIMPASLAARIAPYLRYMPRLTRAQQAAAANFGHFPEASAIGKDDPRIEQFARAAGGARLVSSSSDGRLAPAGEPLGQAGRPASPPPVEVAIAAPAPEPRPGLDMPETAPPARSAARTEATSGPPADPGVNLPRPGFSIDAADPHSELANDAVGLDLASLPGNSGTIASGDAASGGRGEPGAVADALSPELQPAPAAASGVPSPSPVSLAEAFADLAAPTAASAPSAGAVDITAIEPARPARSEPAQEPRRPTHPSRIWVQVATGRDRSALGFDWRRIVREGGAAMKGRNGHIVRWGQTNRLVTGPFGNRREAQEFVATLKQAGIDSFMYTSREGETVDPLPRR